MSLRNNSDSRQGAQWASKTSKTVDVPMMKAKIISLIQLRDIR
jgi:hypothetical protein